MFVLRSLFWMALVVMLLPPSNDGEPAPRVSFLQAAYATRILLQDVTGVCERHPEACATSREALALLGRKLETGAGIVSASFATGQSHVDPTVDHGTLTPADLEPAWTFAGALP